MGVKCKYRQGSLSPAHLSVFVCGVPQSARRLFRPLFAVHARRSLILLFSSETSPDVGNVGPMSFACLTLVFVSKSLGIPKRYKNNKENNTDTGMFTYTMHGWRKGRAQQSSQPQVSLVLSKFCLFLWQSRAAGVFCSGPGGWGGR